MKYRKLTSSGDYSFGNNMNDFVEGSEAIAQAIKTRILLFYREWWEDLNNGIPMFQNIIGQVNAANIQLALESVLTKRIREFSQVKTVSYEEVNIDTKTRSVSFTIKVELRDETMISVSFAI